MTAFDPLPLRAQFPALARRLDGEPVVFLDGPGGTQVPQRVIDAYASYFREHNANTHGAFITSAESDRVIDAAHAAMEDFLGAPPGSVKFGPNMTTLTFMLSRAIGRLLGPGDDIVVTRLDHDANVSPWTLMAADAGATVRWVDIDPSDCTLDLASLDAALKGRPRLVAVGMASNATGTINPVGDIVRRAHEAGAWSFVDAVHYAPHGSIDVQDLETDFLACSIYKFFGPHLGVLYGRPERLAALSRYQLRPAPDAFEPGTHSHEAMAATIEAVEYLADIGRGVDVVHRQGSGAGRRLDVRAAMAAIQRYERDLSERLIAGLLAIPGVTIWGITDPQRFDDRTPTVAMRLEGWAPVDLAAELGRRGIFTWDGDFYAVNLVERLGLATSGGLLRIGLVHYNTTAEVDLLLADLRELAATGPP
ncbi:MAG TPA: cysteine desulfurase-like protein [Candidatus Saccharimonadia bacterium]|nr:cysteine desulfurase-like protein [Candidatus Saccharimonadia bacterium]